MPGPHSSLEYGGPQTPPASALPPAWVHLHRRPAFVEWLGPFEVVCGDTLLGEIAPGEDRTYSVYAIPQQLVLRARGARSRTVTIALEAGEEARFECRARSVLQRLLGRERIALSAAD